MGLSGESTGQGMVEIGTPDPLRIGDTNQILDEVSVSARRPGSVGLNTNNFSLHDLASYGNQDNSSGWTSYIPIYGPGKDAYRDFKNGNYGWGAFNTVMAVSDVFLVKSLFVASGKVVARTAFKKGSHSWKNTRSWMGRRGMASKGQHVHHIYFHRNQGIGNFVPDFIKNQPWNLKPINGIKGYSSAVTHAAIHNNSRVLSLNLMERMYYGGSFRLAPYAAYSINSVENYNR